mmetsp:Transcript_14258/g.39343  ORF Transcript_14258/g.39343 Transcript_14258/m.39343 type:complete len:777 (+) Transcript_14258:19-2349(+)
MSDFSPSELSTGTAGAQAKHSVDSELSRLVAEEASQGTAAALFAAITQELESLKSHVSKMTGIVRNDVRAELSKFLGSTENRDARPTSSRPSSPSSAKASDSSSTIFHKARDLSAGVNSFRLAIPKADDRLADSGAYCPACGRASSAPQRRRGQLRSSQVGDSLQDASAKVKSPTRRRKRANTSPGVAATNDMVESFKVVPAAEETAKPSEKTPTIVVTSWVDESPKPSVKSQACVHGQRPGAEDEETTPADCAVWSMGSPTSDDVFTASPPLRLELPGMQTDAASPDGTEPSWTRPGPGDLDAMTMPSVASRKRSSLTSTSSRASGRRRSSAHSTTSSFVSQLSEAADRPGRIVEIVSSTAFELVTGLSVFLNAVLIGIQADYMAREQRDDPVLALRLGEIFFASAFVVEVAMRFAAYRRSFFFGPGCSWNLFDVVLLAVAVLEEITRAMVSMTNVGSVRVIRVIRLARVIRSMRVLRFVKELRTIVLSIAGSIKSLAWTVVLLSLIIYVFGVCLTQVVSDHRFGSRDQPNASKESHLALELHWGTLGRSLMSLFQSITGGIDWRELSDPLENEISPALGFFVALYIAFVVLALMNVVTGVFVDSALKGAKKDQDNYMLSHIHQLFAKTDQRNTGMITWDDFKCQLHDATMEEFFRTIEVDVSEARGVFQLLDVNESGTIELDEFLNGCLGLHGPAKAIDVATLMYDTREISRHLAEHASIVESTLDRLTATPDPKSLERSATNSTLLSKPSPKKQNFRQLFAAGDDTFGRRRST